MATRRRAGKTSPRKKASTRTSKRAAPPRGSSRKKASSRAAGGKKQRKAVRPGFRGAAGREKLAQELERQEELKEQRKNQVNQPFRLRLSAGERKEVIVVDDQEDDLFFQYEHNMQDPKTGYWNVFTGCIKEDQICPVCENADKESYYALYLTVIDLTEYEDRKGNVHEYSRKLMPVKSGQIGKFLRRLEKEGTLRGALFELNRDGDRDPQIGNDIDFIEMVPEEDLETYVREWTDKDGKVHEEDCSQVFDYEELFPVPTEEELRKKVGGSANAGSRSQAREELEEEELESDEAEWEEEEDEAPWEEEEDADAEEEEEDDVDPDEEEEVEEEEEQPRRKRRASRGGRAPRASGGKKRPSRAAPKAKSRRRGR